MVYGVFVTKIAKHKENADDGFIRIFTSPTIEASRVGSNASDTAKFIKFLYFLTSAKKVLIFGPLNGRNNTQFLRQNLDSTKKQPLQNQKGSNQLF